MSYGLVKESTLTGIADAIRAKNGASTTYKPSEMAAAIAALSTGSSESTATAASVNEGVEFVDHDGTVLYSYTWDEAAALTALPNLPSWTVETEGGFSIPMTCTGWNFTLDDVQNYSGDYLQVGAIYEPTDGKTHMIIWMGVDGDIMLHLTGSVADSAVIIDWGDGSTTETTSSSATTYTHEYGNEADTYYDVTITANNGTAEFTALATSTSTSSTAVRIGCMGSTTASSYTSYRWRNGTLRELYVGNAITAIGSTAFNQSKGLTTVTLPDSVTSIGTYAFYYCTSLTSITLPDSLTSIGTYAFQYCYSLTSITLPDSLTSIGASAFSYSGLVTVDGLYIGSSDTATATFQYCYRLTYLTNVREVNATLYLGESPLDYDSAINLFNGLSDENTGTVTLSSTTYALLDEDDLAIATDKGWTVASA